MIPAVTSSMPHLLLPLLVGNIVACILFGITICQTVWYYRHYPNDSIGFKSLVAVLLVLDVAQTISLTRGTLVVYLRHTFDLTIPGTIICELYLSFFTVTVVQGAYTYRVWIMSNKRRSLTAILAVLSIIEFASSTGLTIFEQREGSVAKIYTATNDALEATAVGATIACDTAVAFSLVYYLSKWRSGYSKTENILDRLIMYVVGIGVLTTIFAVMLLITWFATRQSLLFMAFHNILSKLYVNSLLVTLNARRGLRSDRINWEDESRLALSFLPC